MTKEQLLASGAALVKAFCERNDLETPALQVYPAQQWRFDSTCAYYRKSTIHIALARCAHPGRAGQSWSWPGYVIDRTPHGVMAHELGHHVDNVVSNIKGAYGGDFSVGLRAKTGEPKLTNYCPNDWEWFAEIFRLFVTNPDLLARLRPNTYAELRERFAIVVEETWPYVLKDAPERTVAQAWKKIAEVPRQGLLL